MTFKYPTESNGYGKATILIPWLEKPEQINPVMLDNIAERVSSATDQEHNIRKSAIFDMIDNVIADHY